MTRTFGTLSLERDTTWVMTGIEPHVAIRLKAMFPRIEKTRTGLFTFPHTDEGCADLAWFIQRYPMVIGEGDDGRLHAGTARYGETREMARRILSDAWRPEPGRAPYPYQAQNAALALALGRLLIMDDVGLGKTVSALAALANGSHLPAAIVVQSHLATQWVSEFIEPFTELRAHVIKGTRPYELPAADLFIFKYSNIAGWVDIAAAAPFKAVVFDEVQELRRGRDAAKGRAAAVFAAKASLRIGLSATPIYNYGAEIWNIIEAIEPGALGGYADFCREWLGWGRVVKDPDALGTYLREQHLVVRRERAGNPVNVIPIEVEYDEDVERSELDLMTALALRVVSGTFVERGQAARELDLKMRQITGLAKARHVRILLEAGQPVLLAGWHREVYEIWRKELGDFEPVLYSGSESPKQKDEAKRRFIEGETDLMIISLRSGAGLDGLQRRCATLVVGELDWSPKVHDQLIGRLDRPGQTQDVTAIYLHANGGSDPLVVSMLGLKASQSKGIVDPLSGTSEVHSDDSRIRLMAEQFLARRQIAPVLIQGAA